MQKPKDPTGKFIFLDFEATQDTGEHSPGYVVAQSVCDSCQNEDCNDETKCNSCGSRCESCSKIEKKTGDFSKEPCEGCGKRQVVFEGRHTLYKFCQWLFTKQHRGVTCFCHNLRTYDGYFVYNYLLSQTCPPDVIFNGAKIQYLHLKKDLNIRFLDSLNFLPMPLKDLPATFGFQNEAVKGYFPHFFNKEENQNYIGPLPSPETYGFNQMQSEEREKFLTWYNENKTKDFDFRHEMHKYCRADVDILRKACMKFRETMKQVTGDHTGEEVDPETKQVFKTYSAYVDPFQYLTIASVCMGIYRYMSFEEDWSVLLKEEKEKAQSEDREPLWCQAKMEGKFRLKMKGEGDAVWVPVKEIDIAEKKFVSSPMAMIPPGGYAARNTYSKSYVEWLQWESHRRGIHIYNTL